MDFLSTKRCSESVSLCLTSFFHCFYLADLHIYRATQLIERDIKNVKPVNEICTMEYKPRGDSYMECMKIFFVEAQPSVPLSS